MRVKKERESFKFGNGGRLISLLRVRLPAMICNTLVLVWLSVVPCDSLGCLLGKDFCEAIGAVVDFGLRILQAKKLNKNRFALSSLSVGHFFILSHSYRILLASSNKRKMEGMWERQHCRATTDGTKLES